MTIEHLEKNTLALQHMFRTFMTQFEKQPPKTYTVASIRKAREQNENQPETPLKRPPPKRNRQTATPNSNIYTVLMQTDDEETDNISTSSQQNPTTDEPPAKEYIDQSAQSNTEVQEATGLLEEP